MHKNILINIYRIIFYNFEYLKKIIKQIINKILSQKCVEIRLFYGFRYQK